MQISFRSQPDARKTRVQTISDFVVLVQASSDSRRQKVVNAERLRHGFGSDRVATSNTCVVIFFICLGTARKLLRTRSTARDPAAFAAGSAGSTARTQSSFDDGASRRLLAFVSDEECHTNENDHRRSRTDLRSVQVRSS